jgi:peptide/nickel transport system permease protein
MAEEKKILEEENLAPETETQEDLHGENLGDRVKVLSPGALVAKRFFRSTLSVIGLVVLILLFVISFIGPIFSPWADDKGNPIRDYSNAATYAEVLEVKYIDEEGNEYVAYSIIETDPEWYARGDISWQHWLGTDDDGYDIFTNLLIGGRYSLTIGFVVIILETVIGVLLAG